jgi:hypothetical protein
VKKAVSHKGLVEIEKPGPYGFLSFFSEGWEGCSQPLAAAHVAQLAERVLGKDEVTSSTLVMGSITI